MDGARPRGQVSRQRWQTQWTDAMVERLRQDCADRTITTWAERAANAAVISGKPVTADSTASAARRHRIAVWNDPKLVVKAVVAVAPALGAHPLRNGGEALPIGACLNVGEYPELWRGQPLGAALSSAGAGDQ